MLRASSEALPQIVSSTADSKVSGSRDLFTAPSEAQELHKVYRKDGDDALNLPNVIIPHAFDTDDFFAKLATYYPKFSPITAFTHVLGKEQASVCKVSSGRSRSIIEPSPERWHLVSLGAALGEVVLASQDAVLPSYSACRRTLAFAIARSKTLYPECSIKYIADRWLTLRHLSRTEAEPAAFSGVALIHEAILGDELTLPPKLINAVKRVAHSDLSFAGLNGILQEAYPGLEELVRELTSGPFDGRLQIYSKILELFRLHPVNPHIDSVAAAFYCNQILPGSFNHYKLLARSRDSFPVALLWYGVFSCLSPQFDLVTFALGLGAKLMRDMLEPFTFDSRPVCDISLDEFSILSRIPIKPEIFKPTQPKIALVALLPGVNSYTRFAGEEDATIERDRATIELEEANARASMLMEEAVMILRRVNTSSARRNYKYKR